MSKPFLKWVGGKSQILDDVLAKFPPTMRNYYEPFLGGGSVLFGLLAARQAGSITVTGTINASDLNRNLINLYKQIQSSPAAVCTALTDLYTPYRAIQTEKGTQKPKTREEALTSKESYFYWIRTQWNALTGPSRETPAAAAMMLFLNKTCFRGVYREGPNGFNVPFGHYKTEAFPTAEEFQALATTLKDVNFTVTDFSVPLAATGPGDFIYLDPPYAPEEATSFVGYTVDGFSGEQHAALFAAAKNTVARGATFLLSNAAVPLVTGAFPLPTYETTQLAARRAINSKNPAAKTKEVLIRPAAPQTPS
jgi:DNA adenine methylase